MNIFFHKKISYSNIEITSFIKNLVSFLGVKINDLSWNYFILISLFILNINFFFFLLFLIIKTHKNKNALLSLYTDLYNKKNYIFNCKSLNPTFYENNFEIYNISKKPKISIIIPIYNKSAFLQNILCSLENQKIKDIEIVFVDDFSSDNSTKIIENFQIKDKRIKLIKNQKNMGVFYSRYNGFKNSRGKYILFVDPDDLLFNILNEVYDFIEIKKVDIVQFD